MAVELLAPETSKCVMPMVNARGAVTVTWVSDVRLTCVF